MAGVIPLLQELKKSRAIFKHHSSQDWEMYLEMFPRVISVVDNTKSLSYYSTKMTRSVILIVKEPSSPQYGCFYELGNLEDYVSYLVSKKTYLFKRKESNKQTAGTNDIEMKSSQIQFELEISCFASPQQLIICVCAHLNVHPEYFRLFKEDEPEELTQMTLSSFKHLAEVVFLAENDRSVPLFIFDVLPLSLPIEKAVEMVYIGNLHFITLKGIPLKLNTNFYIEKTNPPLTVIKACF